MRRLKEGNEGVRGNEVKEKRGNEEVKERNEEIEERLREIKKE